MNFETTELFDKQAKKLGKKYRNIKKDLKAFIEDFDTLQKSSISIQKNLYKIRIANSSKNKGKSAGYRVYYYVQHEETVYLLTIYDKSEVEMIDEELLKDLLEDLLA